MITIEQVSLVGIAVSVILYMALGFAWYSPYLFGRPWMRLMGYTAEGLKKAQQEMGMMYVLSMLASVVTAFILAQTFKWLTPETVTAAMSLSFLLWLGFIAPVQFTEVLFAKRQIKLYAINTGYQLAGMLVMAVTLFYLTG